MLSVDPQGLRSVTPTSKLPSLWCALLGVTSRFVEADGILTRILEAGSGPPLILLHGTGGHVEAWAHNVSALAKRYHVIAIDMVGHGLSDKPHHLHYVVPDYTDHVRAVMDALDVRRAHFVGLSLGAWVACWLALETPGRVVAVVNCTGGVFRWPEGQAPKEARERTAMAEVNEGLNNLNAESVRTRLHSLFYDGSRCPEELVQLRLALYDTPDARRVLPRLHAMIPYDSPGRIRYALTPERLEALSVPVLYLWGEHNPGGSISGAERATRATATAKMVVMPGVGHWPQWEAPDEFNREVLDFLGAYEFEVPS